MAGKGGESFDSWQSPVIGFKDCRHLRLPLPVDSDDATGKTPCSLAEAATSPITPAMSASGSISTAKKSPFP